MLLCYGSIYIFEIYVQEFVIFEMKSQIPEGIIP